MSLKRSTANLVRSWLMVFACTLLGCSDEKAPGATPRVGAPEAPPPSGDYALRVLVSKEGEEQLVRVLPADAALAIEPGSEGSLREQTSTPGMRTQALIHQDGGTVDTSLSDEFLPGRILLMYAVASCDSEFTQPNVPTYEAVKGPLSSAWSDVGVGDTMWYIFRSPPYGGILQQHYDDQERTCDQLLHQEELLLCAADRLAELADSPGTVTWHSYDPIQGTVPVTITIPPQDTKDKFIARDMAFNALAHLAKRELFKVRGAMHSAANFTLTCAEYYKALAADGNNWGLPPGGSDFGPLIPRTTVYFDDPPVNMLTATAAARQAVGRARVERQTNILAGASRLTKDLIDASIRDDLSGAQQQLATAGGDPRSAWGVAEGQSPYNTIRHAYRVLMGRLEIGPSDAPLWSTDAPRNDPRCGFGVHPTIPGDLFTGTAALDLLPDAGYGIDARWQDTSPKTQGESLALSLFDRAGIVIPADKVVQLGVTDDQLRNAVVTQLLRDAAARQDMTLNSPLDLNVFKSMSHGRAVTALLENVTDAEIRFALQRVYGAFRLIAAANSVEGATVASVESILRTTGTAAGLTLNCNSPPMNCFDAPEITSVGGVVVKGGLPRHVLGADVYSRTELSQLTSQCGRSGSLSFAPNLGGVEAFQNVFFLGEVFRRRLAATADRVSGVSGLESTKEFAKTVAAEIREWAGPGVILRQYDQPTNKDRYYFVNFQLSDLGITSASELLTRLVTTSEQPIVADCLAGVRTVCPQTLDVQLPSAAVDIGTLPTQSFPFDNDQFGLDTNVLRVDFAHVNGAKYLVLKPSNGSPGKVLTVMRGTHVSNETFLEVVSDYQRNLLQDVLGVQQIEQTERTCTNITPLALPQSYCIDGMKRDQFVPLENELTSVGAEGEDSWRHYLTLAEDAAAKTDELGRQMIEIGIARDLRKEGAVEEFGELCGVFPENVDSTSVSQGKIADSESDSAVNECIGGATVDLVFLRDDPFNNPDDTTLQDGTERPDAQTKICEIYCAGAQEPGFCKKCGTGQKITHDGLGFWTSVFDKSVPVSEACKDAATAYGSVASNFDAKAFGSVADTTWASSTAFANLVAGMKLVEHLDRQWMLSIYGAPVIGTAGLAGTTAADVWPACLATECSETATFIGSFFQPPAQGDTYYNAVRKEVERLVFYVGALAGGIPAGVIEMPVPVANRAELENSQLVPAPALYASGNLQPLIVGTPEGEYQLTNGDYHGHLEFGNADKNSMGKVTSVENAAFWSDRIGGPDWRTQIYTDAQANTSTQGYLAAEASNSEILFDAALSPGQPGGREGLAKWMKSISTDYQDGTNGLDALTAMRQIAYYSGPQSAIGTATGAICEVNQTQGGRHVCNGAPVDPIFFSAWEPYTYSCYGDVLATTRLVSTITPETAIDADVFPLGQLFQPEEEILCEVLAQDFPCAVKWAWGTPAGCNGQPWALSAAPVTCEQLDWSAVIDWSVGSARRAAHDRLLPRYCSPGERLEMFLETDLADKADAMQVLARSLALSCTFASGHIRSEFSVIPPALETVGDVAYLEQWVGQLANVTKAATSALVVVDVPEQVVANVKGEQIGVDNVGKGARGTQLLELQEQLEAIEMEFNALGTALSLLRGEISNARGAIESATLSAQQQALAVALQRLENQRQMAVSSAVIGDASLMTSLSSLTGLSSADADSAVLALGTYMAIAGSSGGTSVAAAFVAQGLFKGIGAGSAEAEQIELANISLDIGTQIDENLDEQAQVLQSLEGNEISTVLGQLGQQTAGHYQAINSAITGIRTSTSDALQTLNALKQNESNARIALAKASEADYAMVGSQKIPLHVNTVYRRQFDVLKMRYMRSLASAKRLAYLARLAIEERIGTRLDDITSSVGAIEAPSLWVDDLCTVQGIDYNALRTANEETGSVVDETGVRGVGGEDSIDVISGFADQYVGDYVAKLEEFVEFYNIQHPFHEADDSAIISLREDLPGTGERCVTESRNLLYASDHLESFSITKGSSDAVGGWRISPCDDASCLSVVPGVGLENSFPGPMGTMTVQIASPIGVGGPTWLKAIAPIGSSPDNTEGIPTGIVYQTVELRGGTKYLLSWWDMARAANGNQFTSGEPETYSAAAFDKDWQPIAVDYVEPEASDPTGQTWSARRALVIEPFADGKYHIGFSAAPVGTPGVSLALANVQLEEANGNSAEPTAYQSVAGNRSVLTGDCPVLDPKAFRDRFAYQCDDDGCAYVLKDGLIIDSELLNKGASSLVGKVAAGNYNYRHVNVSVNLVGTGVTDCAQVDTPSCYTQGYVEYDLEHFARNIPIEDYVETVRCFDFGVGHIRSGKALATERVLTIPLGSSDKELISSGAFLKAELTGRPLSGTYTLKIKDSPKLAWDNVEDVQILVNYRYWSRVDSP